MRHDLRLATICCVLVFFGCASKNLPIATEGELAAPESYRESVLEREDLSANEKAALEIALDNFETYLVNRYGTKRFGEFSEEMKQSHDLYESLSRTYDTTPVLLLQEYAWRYLSSRRAVSKEWLASTSDHFVFEYHPGSPAERDIELIRQEAENTLLGACTYLGYTLDQFESTCDSLVEMRDSTSGLFFFGGGEWGFSGGKVLVILTEDLSEYHDLGGPQYSTGVNVLNWIGRGNLGPSMHCNPRLMFRYVDALQLMTLDHEVVHCVHSLAPAAPPPAFTSYWWTKMEGGVKEFTQQDHERVTGVNYDRYLQEGLATSYQVRYGLLPKAMAIPGARRMAADLMRAGYDFRLDKIVAWNRSLNVFEKALTVLGKEKYVKREQTILYLGAASFVEYILAEFGPEHLHQLMASTDGSASDRIAAVFGVNLEQMDGDWRQWIIASSH